MKDVIPIIIMTRNEGVYLQKCVKSIIDTVSVPYHIYIIDNNSSQKLQNEILVNIENEYADYVTIIRNKYNLWILGLNSTLLKLYLQRTQKYFFLTDGDIDFSSCNAEPCWLSYLVAKMENNISIGKIGLTLNWDYISSQNDLKLIYQQEQGLYNNKKKIEDLFVSPVDTTAALIRWDWSIEGKPSFYPDHIRYLRPELYSCRTPLQINVVHLGWYNYGNNSLSRKSIEEKIKCFILVGGDVKDEILQEARLGYRLLYKLFSGIIKKMWYFRRYYFLFKYILLKGIRIFDGQSSI